MIVLLIGTLGAGLVQLTNSANARRGMTVDRRRALYVAEAGLSEATLAVAQGKSGRVGTEDIPALFADGLYWVEATQLEEGRVSLASHGLCGVGRFSIEAVLQRQLNPISSLGVFGGEALVVGSGAVVDGFDSGEEGVPPPPGELTDPLQGAVARLNSNGNVTVEGADPTPTQGPAPPVTEIHGEVHAGPRRSLTLEPGVVITGATNPLERRVELPEITLPELDSSGDVTHGAGTPFVVSGQQVRYGRLEVLAGGTLEVVGPATLVVAELVLGPGATVVFDAGQGPIGVFCTELLDFAEGSVVSCPSQVAGDVALIVAAPVATPGAAQPTEAWGPTVELDASGAFYGMFYAPRSEVTVPSTLRVVGSIAAARLGLAEGARVTFDEATTRSGVGLYLLPQLLSWRIVDLPDSPLVKNRTDPLQQLALAGITPVPSPLAHVEKDVRIDYIDAADAVTTYTGPVSAFNWANLAAVVDVGWIDPDTGTEVQTGVETKALPNVPSILGGDEQSVIAATKSPVHYLVADAAIIGVTLGLTSTAGGTAEKVGGAIVGTSVDHLGNWSSTLEWPVWSSQMVAAGSYDVVLSCAVAPGDEGGTFTVLVGTTTIPGTIPADTGGASEFRLIRVGTLTFPVDETHGVTLRATSIPGTVFVNLESVILVPL